MTNVELRFSVFAGNFTANFIEKARKMPEKSQVSLMKIFYGFYPLNGAFLYYGNKS